MKTKLPKPCRTCNHPAGMCRGCLYKGGTETRKGFIGAASYQFLISFLEKGMTDKQDKLGLRIPVGIIIKRKGRT